MLLVINRNPFIGTTLEECTILFALAYFVVGINADGVEIGLLAEFDPIQLVGIFDIVPEQHYATRLEEWGIDILPILLRGKCHSYKYSYSA